MCNKKNSLLKVVKIPDSPSQFQSFRPRVKTAALSVISTPSPFKPQNPIWVPPFHPNPIKPSWQPRVITPKITPNFINLYSIIRNISNFELLNIKNAHFLRDATQRGFQTPLIKFSVFFCPYRQKDSRWFEMCITHLPAREPNLVIVTVFFVTITRLTEKKVYHLLHRGAMCCHDSGNARKRKCNFCCTEWAHVARSKSPESGTAGIGHLGEPRVNLVIKTNTFQVRLAKSEV